MKAKTVKIRVRRFDPSSDASPHFQTYEIPFAPRMTVMDALDYIYERLDHTIAYHSHTSCHRRACTRCNLTINNQAGLSCHTEIQGDVTLEPLPKFKIVRDLVVEGI
ncbi:MAG TPA: 2Fe-2S iron-sulfur cluster-binding protein [Terriglobales bacterium]|nr:2Fe-2S iron-sulfur cluster-binding protein [Terriglobales bacterium]